MPISSRFILGRRTFCLNIHRICLFFYNGSHIFNYHNFEERNCLLIAIYVGLTVVPEADMRRNRLTANSFQNDWDVQFRRTTVILGFSFDI
jgi:hypothetical protein